MIPDIKFITETENNVIGIKTRLTTPTTKALKQIPKKNIIGPHNIAFN